MLEEDLGDEVGSGGVVLGVVGVHLEMLDARQGGEDRVFEGGYAGLGRGCTVV